MSSLVFHKLNKGDSEQQVICFPYLGGYSSAFFELAKNLSKNIEIWAANPPGHGSSSLSLMEDIEEVLELYCVELESIIKPNAIFFGHSMGGVIAYFLAKKIANSKQYLAKPAALMLSACTPPCDFRFKCYSKLPDDNLVKHVISYDGIPDIFINEKYLLQYFLPAFRADFKILESTALLKVDPLDISIHCLWGNEDKIVPLDSIARWSRYTAKHITITTVYEGQHLFIHDKAQVVAKHIENIMQYPYHNFCE